MSGASTSLNAWPALQNPIFRMLWIASLVSNIGTWMHELGAAWLMTSLTKEPLWVALIQATTSLSVCILALPAGALADILDKRRYLVVVQASMLISATLLAIVTILGKMTPDCLLFLTFCLGAGAALSTPTWQAIIPEIVSSKDLFSAIILNGISTNISRAIGPAIAGMIIAAMGPGAVFSINAISFLGIIFVLKRWQREPNESTLPAERLYSAIRAGIRYVKWTPILQNVMVKSSAFYIFASASWALIPLVARFELKCGPFGFGLLLASFGIGAILGALILPKLHAMLNIDKLIFTAGIGFTCTNLILGMIPNIYIACFAMFLGGLAWVSVAATLNTVAQQSVSSWVRARALSVYLMIFFGSIALGSAFWGGIATHFGISLALVLAALGLFISNIFSFYFRLDDLRLLDHTPTKDSPAPIGQMSIEHEQGPVMINVEYRIKKENHDKFAFEIQYLRRIRLREGAFFWSLFHDIEDPDRFVECFMAESWLEHLRFHERVSISDRKVQVKVMSFHEGIERPKVTHFVANQVPPKLKEKYKNENL